MRSVSRGHVLRDLAVPLTAVTAFLAIPFLGGGDFADTAAGLLLLACVWHPPTRQKLWSRAFGVGLGAFALSILPSAAWNDPRALLNLLRIFIWLTVARCVLVSLVLSDKARDQTRRFLRAAIVGLALLAVLTMLAAFLTAEPWPMVRRWGGVSLGPSGDPLLGLGR